MSDRIASMMEETNSEMAGDSANTSTKSTLGNGRDRINSIMNMEDDAEIEENPAEPEDNKLEDGPLPSKSEKKEKKEKDNENEEEIQTEELKEEKPVLPEKKKIKYKVDGQEIEEEVTEQDLINSYSGNKALQRRFTEFDKKNKEFESKKAQIENAHKYVVDELGAVQGGFNEVVKNFNELGYSKKDPLDTVYNLLDKMNIDPASYQKALFFHMIPEVSKFLDMSDEGRDAYLLKKENEWFQKKHSKLGEAQKANAAERQRLEAENSIKQKYGVSEEKFSELKDELVNKFGMNPNELKTEQIIGWSLEKPAYDRATALVEKAGVDAGNTVKVAKLLHQYPNTTDEEILDAFGYKDKQAEELKTKLKDKIPPRFSSSHVKLDEQVDEDFNKRFRRR